MTDLAAQMQADIDGVFLRDLGVDALYTSADGSAKRQVRGVLDRAYAEAPGEFAPTAGREVVFTTRETYWPDSFAPAIGGTLAVRVDPLTTTTYTIRAAEPDGTGVVMLRLEAP